MTTEQIARPVRRLYTVPELQEVLRCKRSTAYALVRKGGALHRDVVRVGRLVRVPEEALDRWIADGGGRVTDKMSRERRRVVTGPGRSG